MNGRFWERHWTWYWGRRTLLYLDHDLGGSPILCLVVCVSIAHLMELGFASLGLNKG